MNTRTIKISFNPMSTSINHTTSLISDNLIIGGKRIDLTDEVLLEHFKSDLESSLLLLSLRTGVSTIELDISHANFSCFDLVMKTIDGKLVGNRCLVTFEISALGRVDSSHVEVLLRMCLNTLTFYCKSGYPVSDNPPGLMCFLGECLMKLKSGQFPVSRAIFTSDYGLYNFQICRTRNSVVFETSLSKVDVIWLCYRFTHLLNHIFFDNHFSMDDRIEIHDVVLKYSKPNQKTTVCFSKLYDLFDGSTRRDFKYRLHMFSQLLLPETFYNPYLTAMGAINPARYALVYQHSDGVTQGILGSLYLYPQEFLAQNLINLYGLAAHEYHKFISLMHRASVKYKRTVVIETSQTVNERIRKLLNLYQKHVLSN